MSDKARKLVEGLIGDKRFLSLIVFSSLAVGLCTRYFLQREQPISEAIGGLCDALFIASFLAIVVDPLLKQTFLREATKDVFSFIYGYSLPQELRDFVNDVVLKATVVRRQCHLEWKVEPTRNYADKVALYLNASFLIENFTNEARKYQHTVVAWSDSPTDVGSVEDLYCQDQITQKQRYHLTTKNLQSDLDGYVRGEEIELLPRTNPQRPLYRMGAHYYSESGASGLDQFTFFETTIDVEVTVTVDRSFCDHTFSISPAPSNEPEHVSPEFDAASGTYRCHWMFKRVFVPNETLIIRWQRQP